MLQNGCIRVSLWRLLSPMGDEANSDLRRPGTYTVVAGTNIHFGGVYHVKHLDTEACIQLSTALKDVLKRNRV